MEQSFGIGELVSVRVDPTRSGAIIEVLAPIGGVPRYRVYHSPSDIREYDQDQLIRLLGTASSDDLVEAIIRSEWLDSEVFRARLTASRLAHPQVDNLYALQAARIQFIPFQFKPLLRFLRADRPRLLIADEVGVGKTIEAGLILKELQTRQQVGNVMVVCPKALVTKWQKEMRRFDEDFRPLTSETLRYCLREAHLDGAWPQQYSRVIVHLELLRAEEYLFGKEGRQRRPGLMELDPPPFFGVLIVDEAHHLRNPGTNSYELARYLCDESVSDAVLFLSATPVHIGSRNLFTLLNLLRPDLFPDEAVFAEIVEPNRHITEAMRHVRTRRPEGTWQVDAATALGNAANTPWGRQVLAHDPRLAEWERRVRDHNPLADEDRVRCLRDLEDIHSLAHVMNRTRRRDIGRFTLREPHTISVSFSAQQEAFYRALIEFRRKILLLQYDPLTARLIIDSLERQAASCLPALVPTLDRFLQIGRFSSHELSDAPEEEDEDIVAELTPELIMEAQSLRAMAGQLPDGDPKYDALDEIVQTTMNASGPGKVLIFSFFLHTLAYLERRLRTDGYRVATITGRVPDEEREHLRERFRLPKEHQEAIDVLLSSEVGTEGLDYEFCDRLINYDIPWNPMRIEQRIGRIDRFGQRAEKVLIFNFITPGTVEERIFFRCYERLGIFRDAVGDLEEVLGEIVDGLNRVALDASLTDAQAEEKTRQTADNVLRLIEERRRLEEDSGQLLALDQAFVEEVDAFLAEGRYVSPDDLHLMVDVFLQQPQLGGRISPDEKQPGINRVRLNREARGVLLEQLRALGNHDRATTSLMRWLDGDEPQLQVTFDQKAALERRELAFITPVHPLARLAVEHWRKLEEPLIARLFVSDNTVPVGRYHFVCELWEILSIRPELRLVGMAWDIAAGRVAPEVSSSLLRLLGSAGEPTVAFDLPAFRISEGFEQLKEETHKRRSAELVELRERNGVLAARKLAALDAYYRNRLQRVQTELLQMTNERIVRMKEAELARVERDHALRRKEIESRLDADILSHRVAAGVLEVGGDK